MLLNIFSIENKKPNWSENAFSIYKKRFDNSIEIQWINLKPEKKVKSSNKQIVIKKESLKLLDSVCNKEIIVSLDKKGSIWNTHELKEKFEEWKSSSQDISFLIGGAYGLSSECLKRSDETWSLSPLTFPHSVVPVLVIEQLYRVWSISKNHPYHK